MIIIKNIKHKNYKRKNPLIYNFLNILFFLIYYINLIFFKKIKEWSWSN
jgi:hypothetical protein